MAQHGRRLADRDVVLEVLLAERVEAEGSRPPAVDEQPGELEVALVPGRAGKLDQRHLDFRMTADAHPAVGPELVVHVIGEAPRDLWEVVVVAGPQPGDRRLEEMTEAVKLVPGLKA